MKTPPREELRPLPRADVAVIGGGVVGIACALELARRGATVTVLERDRIGSGCSFGNAGWLTPSLSLPLAAPGMLRKATRWLLDPESPLYIQPRFDAGLARWIFGFLAATRRSRFERGARAMLELCRVSVDLWEELARRVPERFGFERHGLVAVYEHREVFEHARAMAELVASQGIPYEVWSADDVRAREPAVVGPQVGAYYFPDDAHCEPYPAVLALAAEARRAGVTFVEGAEVYAVERNHAAIGRLSTTLGTMTAEKVVLAAGAWCEPFGSSLGLRLPILGAKGYSLVLPKLERHPRHSIYLAERKIAINPHADALRISGTLELVRDDLSINRRRVGAIVRGASGMLALPQPLDIRELWRGLRPCAPDGMPLIGRARGIGNLWLATGDQMTGLKTATGTGRLVAQLMTGEAPSFDPEPFRADRY